MVIDKVLEIGHQKKDIVVLTAQGEKSSKLIAKSSIGKHLIRRPAGRNPDGSYYYTDGDILMETVFRFKGRSAYCVILTEIDLVRRDENARRGPFVGLTRARLQIGLVEKTKLMLQEP